MLPVEFLDCSGYRVQPEEMEQTVVVVQEAPVVEAVDAKRVHYVITVLVTEDPVAAVAARVERADKEEKAVVHRSVYF